MVLCGLQAVFLLAIVEFMIRGMRVNLPWLFHGPLCLLLCLGYSLLLVPGVSGIADSQIRWCIAAIAGAITLMLLPAVWIGARSTRSNGTPWSWPWFPYTVFGFVALLICFRAYSLTISFDTPSLQSHYWDTAFGLYCLIPFALAVLVVILEIAVVEQLPRLKTATLPVAPLLLVIAYPWIVPWTGLLLYNRFVYEVTQTIGSARPPDNIQSGSFLRLGMSAGRVTGRNRPNSDAVAGGAGWTEFRCSSRCVVAAWTNSTVATVLAGRDPDVRRG